MSNTIISPNMSLPIPVTSIDSGPDFANNINASLLTIDSHNHSSGQGIAIGPSGIDINADLPFLNNNAISLRSTRYTAQAAPLSAVTDYLSLNVSGADLYYLDGNGNSVRITQSGGVAGSPGSIGSLTAPASATYVSATPAFVFQSDSNIAANLDGGSLVIRKLTASSPGITLSAPSALSGSYTITLPAAAPASQLLLQMDSAGNVSASNTTASGIKIGSSGPTLSYNSGIDALLVDKQIQIGGNTFAAISSYGDDRTLIAVNAAGTVSNPIMVGPSDGTHGLKLICGFISDGTKVYGVGYTSSKVATGKYDITYSVEFSEAWSIPVASIFSAGTITSTYFTITSLGAATFRIETFNAAGTHVAADVLFHVVGMR